MYRGDWLLRLGQLASQPRARWRVPPNVWGLGITSLLTDISSEMIVSVLPAYLVLTAGFAPTLLGVATGLHEGGPLLVSWIGGWAADRSGRRKLTALSGYALSAACRLGWLLLPTGATSSLSSAGGAASVASAGAASAAAANAAIGTASASASTSASASALASLIVSDRVGKAIRTAPRDALISLSVDRQHLATAFGVHRALDAAGAAAGPVLAFTLLWHFPRRFDLIFFTAFIVALLGVAALLLLVREGGASERDDTIGTGTTHVWSETLKLFTNPALRRIAILALAFGLVSINDAFVYVLLMRQSPTQVHWIPLLYAGTATAFLLLAVPIGVLADRIGRQRIFILGHAPLLIAYAISLDAFDPFGAATAWPANAILCVLLLGSYYASTDGVLAGLASGRLPASVRSMGLASVDTALSLGRLAGAMLFGLLWTRAGAHVAVVTFASAMTMLMIVFTFMDRSEPTET